MHELGPQLAALRDEVQVAWTEERARRVEQSLAHRRRRQPQRRAALAIGAALLLLLVAGRERLRSLVTPPQPPASTENRQRTPTPAPQPMVGAQDRSERSVSIIALHDGSIVRLLDPASRIVELAAASAGSDATVMAFELQSGGAHFRVMRNPERVFRVQAGQVTIEVLGTEFTVVRVGEYARVTVEEGRVRVAWPSGSRELVAGEAESFPPPPESDAWIAPPPRSVSRIPARPLGPAAERRRGSPRTDDSAESAEREVAESSWMTLARQGNFDHAYAVLSQQGLEHVRGPAELLLAADVARLSHHPAAAVAPLRQLLRDHAQDPRAPLAAFTLGRGLLDELGRPREAAEAFQTAQELAPDGPLAGDALAREVEAWSRAGEALRARERAVAYLKRFPDGDRLRSVKRHGGLE